MAASHIVNTSRSCHASFLKLKDPLLKWTFDILISNEFTSRSGIYKISSGFLSDRIACEVKNKDGIPELDAFGIPRLTNTDDAKKILKELCNIGVIDYEPISHVVYIKNFVEMVPFGLSAHIISTAICKEYKNFFIKDYWKDFFWNYGKYILDYISASEFNSEKNAKKAMKKNNKLSKDDFTIITEEMKILRNLIETSGYDENQIRQLNIESVKD